MFDALGPDKAAAFHQCVQTVCDLTRGAAKRGASEYSQKLHDAHAGKAASDVARALANVPPPDQVRLLPSYKIRKVRGSEAL